MSHGLRQVLHSLPIPPAVDFPFRALLWQASSQVVFLVSCLKQYERCSMEPQGSKPSAQCTPPGPRQKRGSAMSLLAMLLCPSILPAHSEVRKFRILHLLLLSASEYNRHFTYQLLGPFFSSFTAACKNNKNPFLGGHKRLYSLYFLFWAIS